jgi:hypothetical protein
MKKFGSGMEKFGSGINIPDLQHRFLFVPSYHPNRVSHSQLDSYTGIPFTMQRLCELITEPRRHYKRIDKFMRGLEKIMLVVTTIEPTPEQGMTGRGEGFGSGFNQVSGSVSGFGLRIRIQEAGFRIMLVVTTIEPSPEQGMTGRGGVGEEGFGSVFYPEFIRSVDPYSDSGSGSRRAKMTLKSSKKLLKFMF